VKNKKTKYDLNALVDTYNIDNIYEQYKRFEFLDKLRNYINLKKSNVLEFGSATGQMTQILSQRTKKVVAVDGSSEFIKIAKKRVNNAGNVQFIETYFENFATNEKFDCLIFHHILEHIKDPVSLLSNVLRVINKNGIIAVSVPNSHALSRQLAVKMGLLNSIYDLTKNDINHGHFRVYDWKILEEQITESGYSILGRHGLSFKLFSDKQNIEMLSANIIGEEQIKGLWLMADELPLISGAIMIVANKKRK
jgi:2-polyprenyl-3-methyl-5-hydroxy-6-metoxy-1,4-benzoquinol methylase